MAIKFKKIIPTETQIDELYVLLKNRKYSISHKSVPSKIEHYDFVSEHPYVYDITVENEHTFILSNGLALHQTFHLAGVSLL